MKAIASRQNELMTDRVENDTVVILLMQLIEHGPIEGTVGAVFDQLAGFRFATDRYFPSTPAHLSKRLKQLKPAMAKAGIFVEFGPKTREGRIIKIWKEGQNGQDPKTITIKPREY